MATTIIKAPAQIRVSGQLFDSVDGTWEINFYPNETKVEVAMSANRNMVKTLSFVPSSIKGKILMSSVIDLTSLLNSDQVSVVVTGPTHTYILSSAVCIGDHNISADSSEVDLEFQGFGQVIPV